MATTRWRGDAPAIAQVDTVQITGYHAATTYRLTINGKTVSTIAQGSVNATATSLAALWNASTIPEFAEVTASAATDTVTLTGDTAGRPFTCISSVSGGSGTIGSVTSSVACSGPNFWNAAANFSGGSVPTTEDVVIDSGADILYGLSNSGNTMASLTIMQSYSGKIGLPYINTDGTTDYIEYRTGYLTQEATLVNIGLGVGPGSARIKLNLGSVQTAINVFDSGNSEEDGIAAIIIKGTHAANALSVNKGDVDIAPFAGETATLVALNVGYENNPGGDSNVYLGSGVTLANCVTKVSGGQLELNSATSGTATLTVSGGTVILNGTGGHLGLTVRGGEVQYNTTGTLGGNPVVTNSGHLDFSRDLRTKTVTNPVEVYGNSAKVSDPFKVVTTLILDLNEATKLDNMLIGTNIRVTRGTPA